MDTEEELARCRSVDGRGRTRADTELPEFSQLFSQRPERPFRIPASSTFTLITEGLDRSRQHHEFDTESEERHILGKEEDIYGNGVQS